MTIIFELSMPNVGSWNGRWSGEKDLWAVTKSFGQSKKAKERVAKLLETGSWYHGWNDGWGARVSVRVAKDAAEVRYVRKHSRGFCGYEWMISNILAYNSTREPEKAVAA